MTVTDTPTHTNMTESDINPHSDPQTVRILAGHARDLLRAGLACISEDPTDDPMFRTLNLQAGNGQLTVMATDRFVMCHGARPATGELHQTSLSAKTAHRMKTDLDDLDDDEAVTLTVHAEKITLATSVGSVIGDVALLVALPTEVLNLLTADGFRPASLNAPIGLNLALLRRLSHAVDPSSRTRFFFRSPTEQFRIEVEGWLILLGMPYRLTGEDVTAPQITAGLPHEPVTVDLAAADNADFTWPRTSGQVTVGRLVRHHLANSLHFQHRFFHEPYPDRPARGTEPTPEQKALAAAHTGLIIRTVDNYAIAHLLRDFHAAAPAAAAASARQLWDNVEYGDSTIGENAWQWLKDEGRIDPEALDHDTIEQDQAPRVARAGQEIRAAGKPRKVVYPKRDEQDTEPESQDTGDVEAALAELVAETPAVDQQPTPPEPAAPEAPASPSE